jgi:hypothetical protein
MSLDEGNGAVNRRGSRKKMLLLLGIGLLAALPAAGLVLSAVDYVQDASDRTK